ncbi:MAG TPA: recombinase RecA [Planctomycetota bacterium]|jgi:recombination protein RecA|nr:recombinase RecA [Planctomycetota bacterium]
MTSKPEKTDSRDRAGRERAIEAALAEIEKSYGRGAVMKLGEGGIVEPIEGISTGCLSLDLALGGAGVPRGRVVEVFGPESSGKTTLALQVIAQAQRRGGMAVFIDAEHALDRAYAGRLGVDIESLLLSQPDYGEQALDIAETFVRTNALDVIVIDSVAALVPKAELEGEMGDAFVGLQARLMSQALRKLTSSIHRSRTCVLFINQIREKIGVMFGNPETTPGGRALKFYSSTRIDVRRIQTIKENEVAVGVRTKATIVKNKIAPPFRKAEFDIYFNEGISRAADLVDLGAEHGALAKSGTWFSFKDPAKGEIRIGQGREKARDFLRDNPDLMDAIEAELRAKLVKPPVPGTPLAARVAAPPPEIPAKGPSPPAARPAASPARVPSAAKPAPART